MTNKKLIKIIAIVTLALGFFILDYLPKMNRMLRLRHELAVLRGSARSMSDAEKANKKQQMLQELDAARRDYGLAQKTLSDLQLKVDTEGNVPVFLMAIEQTVSAAKLELVSLDPQEATAFNDKKYMMVPFKLALRGTFAQLTEFLSELKKLKTLTAVSEIVIRNDEAAFPKLNLNLTFSMVSSSPAVMKPAEVTGQKP